MKFPIILEIFLRVLSVLVFYERLLYNFNIEALVTLCSIRSGFQRKQEQYLPIERR